MKHITTKIALMLVATIAVECQAEKPKRDRQQQGQRQRPGKQRPGAKDPAQMAAQMMAKFDTNSDNKLNSTELTAMFTSIRERRAQARQGNSQVRRDRGNDTVPRRPANRAAGREGRPRKGAGRRGDLESRLENEFENGGGIKPKRPSGD